MEKGSITLKIAAFVVLFLALSCLVYASPETSNSDKKIDADLLNVEGDTPVIIEFSKKPGNYKQIIKSLGGNIVYDYDLIDAVAVRLEGKNIPQLTKLENLVRVHKNRKFKALLNDSAPLISANSVWAQGYTGKDVKVCIVDSGIDYTHQALGACSLTTANGTTEPYVLESSHPYPISYNYTWTITKPGYTKIAVHFTKIDLESGYDFIYIKDANNNTVQTFTGKLNDVWSVSVPGDAIKINLVSDVYGCLYGFYMDKVLNGTITESFENCKKVVAGYDFVNSDNDPMDDDGHGTHVAGIISSDNQNYRGVANGTKLMAAKVLDAYGNGDEDDVIAGIQWCKDNGAKIISMSLGGGEYPGTCDSDPVAQAVNNAVNNGIVVVVAAGNSGLDGVTTPACASKALAVGATDKNKNVVGYSSKGPELDIVAPGHLIKSTYPGGWVTMSGTSMAAPHVSGVVALMLEAKPDATVDAIRRILNETSDPVNKCYEGGVEIPCDRNSTGSGIVNASRAVEQSSQDSCINIKVQYQDDCPRSDVDVNIISPIQKAIGITDINGMTRACDYFSSNTVYEVEAYFHSGAQFGGTVSFTTDSNGYGSAVIQEYVNYPNGTEVCGDSECSGYQYCLGETKHIECNSWGTECLAKSCCQCDGGIPAFPTENYDTSQTNDCSVFDISGISTCDNIPDNYHPTLDFRSAFTSQCVGLNQCSQGNSVIIHTCNKQTCGAGCNQTSDCSGKCVDKKWYSSYSCNLGTCGCGLSNLKCSVGHCGAECDSSHSCGSNKKCTENCVCIEYNNPPYTPSKPSGPSSGSVGITYNFSVKPTTDPDGDKISSYIWDWGDGRTTNPGKVNASHYWITSGTYLVSVKAVDEHGAVSSRSPILYVNITKPSCACANWQPTFTCCYGISGFGSGKERWSRTCNPAGCDTESKCEGSCFV